MCPPEIKQGLFKAHKGRQRTSPPRAHSEGPLPLVFCPLGLLSLLVRGGPVPPQLQLLKGGSSPPETEQGLSKAHKGRHHASPPRAHSEGPLPLIFCPTGLLSLSVRGGPVPPQLQLLKGGSSPPETEQELSKAHKGRHHTSPPRAHSEGPLPLVFCPTGLLSLSVRGGTVPPKSSKDSQGPQGPASHKPIKGAPRGSASPRFLPFRASVTFSQGWSSPPAVSPPNSSLLGS